LLIDDSLKNIVALKSPLILEMKVITKIVNFSKKLTKNWY
jgi:hypothetical protein